MLSKDKLTTRLTFYELLEFATRQGARAQRTLGEAQRRVNEIIERFFEDHPSQRRNWEKMTGQRAGPTRAQETAWPILSCQTRPTTIYPIFRLRMILLSGIRRRLRVIRLVFGVSITK